MTFKITKLVKAGLFAIPLCIGPAQAETLNLYSSTDTLKPFYWEEQGQKKGIIYDIFSGIKGYDYKVTTFPRKRLDQHLLDNSVDIVLIHPKYTKADENLFFIPLNINQRSVLFKRKDSQAFAKSLDEIKDKSVCARAGFFYVNFSQRWEPQHLRRENANNDEQLLKKLNAGRCDYAIGAELTTHHRIQSMNLNNIEQTSLTVTEVPRYLGLIKKHKKLNELLANHLQELSSTGELENIVKKYAP